MEAVSDFLFLFFILKSVINRIIQELAGGV